ncbi:MAG: flagellar basal body rod C-terminal domain-containing protein, partial [Caldimonas sp.]
FQLTRLSDGQQWTVGDGTIVDGFRLDIGTPAAAAGNRFLLQPVAAAGLGMRRVLDDPKGLAAASPVNATLGLANGGTAGVAELRTASAALNPNLTATLTFGPGGAYTYSLVDSSGALPTTTGSGTWAAGQPIALNGWELQLSGVPANGDSLTVQKTAFVGGDNRNANAMLALRDAMLVGKRVLPDGSAGGGETVTDAYASLLANIGVRVQGSGLAADMSARIASDALSAKTAGAGVNLDEEAARLIQFQQNYQAAAKMLQVAQTVFDTLLQVTSN